MSNLSASIIVPIYNSEKYLEKCLDSLLDQTIEDYEIILIDDGSKDNSGSICDLYKSRSEKIKVIHQKNSGVSCARNVGLDIACGKYILFFDSDDYVENDVVETTILAFENNNCDLFVATKDNFKKNRYEKSFLKEKTISKENFLELWKRGIFGELWNKGFKKNIIEDNDIKFDSTMSYGEDFCFIVEYIQHIKNDIFINSFSVYHYINREGSLVSRYHKDLFENVYSKMFNKIEENIAHFNITEKIF